MTTPCIDWKGCIDNEGYGRIGIQRRSVRAHRWVWEQSYGQVPSGLVVRHACDNRKCVNLEHLLLGTPGDNNNDRDSRQRQARGEKSRKSSLTEIQVIGLMARLLTGTDTQAAIARELGITKQSVHAIWTLSTWAHLFESKRMGNTLQDPKPVRIIPPCVHCGRTTSKVRTGLCGACYEYRRVHGAPRPLVRA
jgi:hypothetical protein